MVFLPRCVMMLRQCFMRPVPANGKNRAVACWAARLPVSAGQAAHNAQRRWEARYWIEAFISCLPGSDRYVRGRPAGAPQAADYERLGSGACG
jgi:hypothetical protein